MARGYELTLFAEEGAVVDSENHRHSGLIDSDGVESFGLLEIANGVANLEALYTNHGADITGAHFGCFRLPESTEGAELFDAALGHCAIALGKSNLHAFFKRSSMYASYSYTSNIWAVIERGDEHLRRALQYGRLGDIFDDGVHQGSQICSGLLPIG